MANAPRSTLPLHRKLLYAGLTTLLGATLFCVLVETALRLGGFGYSPHFARRERLADGTEVWRENRWCTAPYFTPALVRRPQPFLVPVEKAARTYRIFVLGSSAAMGDPDASFSLARMLDTMLRAAYPDVRFEVVNAGITAINSNLVRGIANDCAALRPDLFVVYEGNNEVIGPYGPAGVFAPFLRDPGVVHFVSWAQGTRTVQALAAMRRALSRRDGLERDWGGMQMFLRQEIAAADPRLARVERNFRRNLFDIARSAQAAGASTLLCTVLTNQRDFAPFASRHRPGLSESDRKRWDDELAAAIAAERDRDLAGAEQHFQHAVAIDDQYAELWFRLGRLQLQTRRDADAQTSLQRALDLDTLRFRTDSRLNGAIREVANQAPGTTLVDLARSLAAASAHGVPGDDLLYEHVHLTFRGTYEAAARLAPAIVAQLQRRGLVQHAPTALLTLDEVRERLAFTTYEQAMIAVELLKRFRAPPFTRLIDDGLRVANWQRRLDAAQTLLRHSEATDALATLYASARHASPDDWVLARNAGEMLVARHRTAEAIRLLRQASGTIPDDADTLVALGLAERAEGHDAEAKTAFAAVRRLEPDHPLLPKE